MTAPPYWVQADLEAQMGAEIVAAILDDDNDETVDAAPLAWLQSKSSSYVEGFLRIGYDLVAVRANPPTEVKRLALEAAEWMAARRWPKYVDMDWQAKYAINRQELKDLVKGLTRLDVVATPEPPANVGGIVRSGDPDLPDLVPPFFVNGLGDF